MELDGDGAEHDLLFIVHVHRHTEAGGLGRHHVLTIELLAQAEAGRDVVGVGVGCNGVNEGEVLTVQHVEVVLEEIVNRVDQGRLVGGLIDDEVGHRPNAFVELLKSHDFAEQAV